MLHPEAFATARLNKFMRGLYGHDVFLPSTLAFELANCAYDFVRSYSYQAFAAYNLGLSHYPMHPKLHCVHHVAHELRRQSRISDTSLNPAVWSCALDEDFIGRAATISRAVSPRIIAKRTLQRYLCHIQISWARG